MSILEMGHQGEPLPLHPVTPGPQTGDVIRPEGAVRPDRVIFHLFGRLEGLHAALPLTQEGLLSVYLDLGRATRLLLGRGRGTRGWLSLRERGGGGGGC